MLLSLRSSDSKDAQPPNSPLYLDPLQEKLLSGYGIEVSIIPWLTPPKRLLRLSAQLYIALPQYENWLRL